MGLPVVVHLLLAVVAVDPVQVRSVRQVAEGGNLEAVENILGVLGYLVEFASCEFQTSNKAVVAPLRCRPPQRHYRPLSALCPIYLWKND
jgi:hypothetical protein